MTDPLAVVRRLDEQVRTDPAQAACAITQFIETADALAYVPVIFENATTTMLITAAIKILEKHVARNWRALSPENQHELRGFVENMLGRQGVDASLTVLLRKVLTMMVLRSGPDCVNEYMESIFVNGDYERVAEFLAEVRELKAEDVPAEEIGAMKGSIVRHIMDIFVALMNNVENPAVDKALTEFAPYLTWETLSKCNWNVIIDNENPVLFGPLCTILSVDGLPSDFVLRIMQKLMSFEITDPNLYARIVPVLQKYVDLLQDGQNIQMLIRAQGRLMQMSFMDNLDYWEAFVLSTFAKFKEAMGVSAVLAVHKETLDKLCNHVIRNMTNPVDFFVPGEYYEGTDELNKVQYEQMKTMLLSFITMMPSAVMDMITKVFNELRSRFDEGTFLGVVWSLGCISGATNSKLEAMVVIDSLKFILDAFRGPNVNKPVVSSAFLYLAAKYAKAQKLTAQFLDVAINLGIQALTSEKIQRMGVTCLLSIGKYAAKAIQRLPVALLDVLLNANLPPDIFCKLSEAAARIFHEKGKISDVVEAVRRRWSYTASEEISFEVAHHQRLVMNGFVGIARADPGAIERRFREWKDDIHALTCSFGQALIKIDQDVGYQCTSRDDVQIILGFLKAEVILFTKLLYKECRYIFEMYQTLPNYLRFPEVLKLGEAMFRSELDPPTVAGLREMLVDTTEQMIAENSEDYMEFYEEMPRILSCLIDNYWEAVKPDDLEFLISSLPQVNHTVVLETLKALDKFVARGDLKLVGEQRNAFFGPFLAQLLVQLLSACCESTHQFCYPEVAALLRKLFDFVGTGKLNCRLYPDQENVPGLVTTLSQMLFERFPLVSIPELQELMTLMFNSKDQENFDSLLAQFIARAKQRTASQTLSHLKLRRLKEYVAEFS